MQSHISSSDAAFLNGSNTPGNLAKLPSTPKPDSLVIFSPAQNFFVSPIKRSQFILNSYLVHKSREYGA
jgi:hypothetical protein